MIEAFKPRDIWPCTVDKMNWSAAQSMSFLFGHLYEGPCKFTHDQAMFHRKGVDAGTVSGLESKMPEHSTEQFAEKYANHERGTLLSSSDVSMHNRSNLETTHTRLQDRTELAHGQSIAPMISSTDHATRKQRRSVDLSKSEHAVPPVRSERNVANTSNNSSAGMQALLVAPLSSYEYSEAWKQQAFEAAQGTGSSNWNDITLVSVSGHQDREKEL